MWPHGWVGVCEPPLFSSLRPFSLLTSSLSFSSSSSWPLWQHMTRPAHTHSINQGLRLLSLHLKRSRGAAFLRCVPRGHFLLLHRSQKFKHMLVCSIFWHPQAGSDMPNAEVSVSMAAPKSTLGRAHTYTLGSSNSPWYLHTLQWKITKGKCVLLCGLNGNKHCSRRSLSWS